MGHELGKYRSKRDFGTTTEPRGTRRARRRGRQRRFVLHKHDASTLHYDLRLEIEGTLKSWALPKGPSIDPADRRLAVPTEDHPLEYVDFEGVIPEGEYGAGTVLVWDRGSCELEAEGDAEGDVDAARQLRRGRLDLWLEGVKIRGGYALVRMGRSADGQWLLVKRSDEGADRRRKPLKKQPRSVRSGRDLNAIAGRTGESR
ncbi:MULTISPECIES: DNA polymerase ligase N-terminal domain-containing protein [unclassified Actinopolyspora]|uniref:DNA polymerase ligase N-terminal domain-containing protein n=1 Tax=unclassified Actinopolyspora TaxID=2639451 RepID=UPI0013F6330E|nr:MULTISPECIES: DNA polymerase ligase N-terminal domain-containing protein [unclassified Actinopolyspora]NHD15761.1 DNA ligase [Actinopolyspora sp. BKK2]NHE75025.1 DNA ligase [Actinopolyspora sp. BKK1]